MVDKEMRNQIIQYHKHLNETRRLENTSSSSSASKKKEGKQSPTAKRLLQQQQGNNGGDFAELNAIFRDIEVNIPPQNIRQELLGFNLTLDLNGTCTKFNVNDIVLDYDRDLATAEETSLAYKLELLDVRFKCFIQVDWDTGVLDVEDELKIKLALDENNFGIAVRLNGSPPETSTIEACKTQLNVQNITASGGFSSAIINDLNRLIVDIIRNEEAFLSNLFCEQLQGFTSAIDGLLLSLGDFLEPYLVDLPPADPLRLQNELNATEELVDFTDEEEGFGNILNVLINALASQISADQINTLLINNVLNENGTLVIDFGNNDDEIVEVRRSVLEDEETVAPNSLNNVFDVCPPLGNNRRRLNQMVTDEVERELHETVAIIQDNQRRLQANANASDAFDLNFELNEISPVRIEIFGLDNFTDAQPLEIVGAQTFRTQLFLDQLRVQASVFVDFDFNNVTIQETIQADFEVNGIYIRGSFLVALDAQIVDGFTLGTFLNTANIVPCILSSVVDLGLSELFVTVESFGTPAISGAISDGVDEVLNTGVEAAVCVYQDLFRQVIPVLSQQNVTVLATDFFECFVSEFTGEKSVCPSGVTGEIMEETSTSFAFRQREVGSNKTEGDGRVRGYLDFRDLLLPPDESQELGGSGQQPYGDLVATAFNAFFLNATIPEEDGTGGINGFLPGEMQMDVELFNFMMDTTNTSIINTLFHSISARGYNISVVNIDILVPPLVLLRPTTKAHDLENLFNFGPVPGRPLNANVSVEFDLNGTNTPIVMDNQLDAATRISEIDLLMDIRVMISTQDFINFPLRDLLNINCWLSLVQNPNAMSSDGMVDESFTIKNLAMDIIDLSLKFYCTSCSSDTLEPAIDALERVGAMEVLGNRVGPLVEELGTNDVISPLITNLIGLGDEAGRKCPHHPLYNTTGNETSGASFSMDDLPPLTNMSIDTVMYSGILGAEIFAVVFSESAIENSFNMSDPLSGQEKLLVSNPTDLPPRLLDWTRLNETVSIPFAENALDLVRGFLGANETGGEPGVNGILQDLMSVDGTFNLSLGNTSFAFQDYEISLGDMQIKGLSSFNVFDILEPIAPQTLRNTIDLDQLSVKIGFSIDNTNTTDPPQSFTVSFDLKGVNATIYLFTAIDMEKIEALEIGQLLFLDKLLPCFMSAAYDIHIPAIRVDLGNISEPVFDGLMPETSEAAAASFTAIFDEFGHLFAGAATAFTDTAIRSLVNDLIASFIDNNTGCSRPVFNTTGDFIDFRDLLLPPEGARMLGGSGASPYGDIVSTAYSFLLDLITSNETGQFLELNSQFVDSFTEGQSNVTGMLRFPNELFKYVFEENLPIDFLSWLKMQIELGIFDLRMMNLNTLVSPLAVFKPTTNPYVVENMINVGPIAGKPLNTTLGTLLSISGDLASLNMYNMFDLGAAFSEIDLFVDLTLRILQEDLFRFPVKDVLEFSCWLSLIKPDVAGFPDVTGFGVDSMLAKLASMVVDLNCLNCTSTSLPVLIDLTNDAGAAEVLGRRLGFLVEDVASGDTVTTLLLGFIDLGDEAARSCPHSPLFNSSSTNTTSNDTGLALPPLSMRSLDTVLFAGMVSIQAGLVLISETHVQNPGQETDAMKGQNTLEVPEGTNLLDWTNLDNITIPFVPQVLDLARSLLGGTGPDGPGVNGLLGGFAEGGVFELPFGDISFEVAGVSLAIDTIRLEGVDSFSQFDILYPIAPQVMQNNISAANMKLSLGLSAKSVNSSDAANNVTLTFDLHDVNISVPLFVAIDEDLLGELKIGSLLHLNNLLPCLLSTAHGFRVEQMLVNVGSFSEPTFEGFMNDTIDALRNTTRAIFDIYGDMIEEAMPLIFDDTVRVLLNGFLGKFNQTECKDYSTNTTSRYIDFRQMFRDSNATGFSPYGDLIPWAKSLVEEQFLSNDPETSMPKINKDVIAPFTEGQSGVEGTLLVPGRVIGFSSDGLDLGLNLGTVAVEVYDARIENLDTLGQPLEILEPNATRGDLVDNRVTLGTEFNPLRFAIKLTLSVMGPVLDTRDEVDIFGEFRATPIFAVLLARLGAQEFLTFPLEYASNADCWLGVLAAPALDEIASGNLEVNPILDVDYLNIAFNQMRVSADCFNCSTPGLDLMPDLLEIVETTGTKNVLGFRFVDLLLELTKSDFAQVWLLRYFQDSMRKCPITVNSTMTTLTYENPSFPVLSTHSIETGVFAVTVLIQLFLVVLAKTVETLTEIVPVFPDAEPQIPPGTRLVDFTALDEYALGGLFDNALGLLNSFLGDPEVDEETGDVSLGINSILGNPIFPIEDFSFGNGFDIGLAGLQLTINRVTISGIDTFTKFQIANFTGPTTFRNELGWERFQLKFEMEVDLGNSPRLRRYLQEQEEGSFAFTLTIELRDVAASAEVMMALDYELIRYLELGQLLRLSSILPCIQAAILHFEMTDVELNIGRISKMSVTGFQGEDTSKAAAALEAALLEEYGVLLGSMAPNVFSAAIRPVMNSLINSYLRDSEFECNEFTFDPSDNGFIDFRDLFVSPDRSVELGGSGKEQYGNLIWNFLDYSPVAIRFFLLPQLDNLSFAGALFDQGIRFDVRNFQAEFALKLSDLRFNNIGSVGNLAYVKPIENEAHMIDNEIQFGVGRDTLGIALRVYFHFKGLGKFSLISPLCFQAAMIDSPIIVVILPFQFPPDNVNIHNDLDISMDINTLGLLLTALAKVSEEKFVRFPIRDVLNINCWLATIPPPSLDDEGYRVEDAEPTLAIESLNVSMKELNLGVECFNCSSPGLIELADLLVAPETPEELTRVMNRVLSSLSRRMGGGLLQDIIDRALVNAPKQCPHRDNMDPNAPSFKTRVAKKPSTGLNTSYIIFLVVVFAPLIFGALLAVGLQMLHTQRHKNWMESLPSERVFLIQQKQEKEDNMENEINNMTNSMYKSKDIPCILRYWVPILVVVNIAFFLSGHLSLAGSALVEFIIFGEKFYLEDFYEFSIAQSTLDMWHAGGEELAALILLFSGIWPYTKQLITLALWFLPPTVVSCTRRGQFLTWLDILAKWSMIDIFVLLITVAGFR